MNCFKYANPFFLKNVINKFLKSLVFSFTILLLFSGCEQNNIDSEILRLQNLEKELNKTISENNYNRAKLICIQMEWEYVATTAGAGSKCKKLAEIWDNKRRNYLKLIGFNPEIILGKKIQKIKAKNFEERFLDYD